MERMRKLLVFIFFLIPVFLLAQSKTNENPSKQIKQFWFVLLKAGPNRNQDSATAQKIQAGHMANIGKLYEAGKLKVAGPFGDESLAQGLFIFDCVDEAEVISLLETDPAIKAGRLIFEIHPWYTAPIGSFVSGKPKKN
jgi:uncharacterized protein YciI